MWEEPNIQWEIIVDYITEILSIMCPYKIVNARKTISPWLTPEIDELIREKKELVKRYKKNRNEKTLGDMRMKRDLLNSKIDKAK